MQYLNIIGYQILFIGGHFKIKLYIYFLNSKKWKYFPKSYQLKFKKWSILLFISYLFFFILSLNQVYLILF